MACYAELPSYYVNIFIFVSVILREFHFELLTKNAQLRFGLGQRSDVVEYLLVERNLT